MIANVILKVASRCNLNCSYCYLYNHEDHTTLTQPPQIPDAVFDALLERIGAHAEVHETAMSITLHGGEPTLIGRERMRELVTRARRRLGSRLAAISLQTNATRIDDAWAALLSELDLAVGISLDGPREIHDRVRVTHTGRGSHAAVLRGIGALQRHEIPLQILCVVNPGDDGVAAYEHFRSLGCRSIEFLLPDVSHDNRERFYGNAAHPVADYLLPVLEAWLLENDPRVMIPLFWDLLARSLGSRSQRNDAFGNPAMTYVVVNTDGSIEPLDALKVCEDRLTATPFNVFTHSFDDLMQAPSLLADALSGRIPLSAECRACPDVALCGGGYLPHRYRRANGFDNPSVWCADIKILLERVHDIANTVTAGAARGWA